jgi:hypothetical protein
MHDHPKILKPSLPNLQKQNHYVSITKTTYLMFFKEIIAVYSENHTKPINPLCGQNAGGT